MQGQMTSYLPIEQGRARDLGLPLTASGCRDRPAAQRPHGSKRCPQHEAMEVAGTAAGYNL